MAAVAPLPSSLQKEGRNDLTISQRNAFAGKGRFLKIVVCTQRSPPCRRSDRVGSATAAQPPGRSGVVVAGGPLSIYDSNGKLLPARTLSMQHVVHGVRRFQSEVFPRERQLFETLSAGQHPEVLFIACSDSRIETSHITQLQPGELFVIRNVGNIVPPYDAAMGAAGASIEYAVSAINVKDIIVCGHSHCGAMRSLLHPETMEHLPCKRFSCMRTRRMKECLAMPGHLSEEECLERAVEENVLVQIEHLKTHPAVATALAAGKVNLHGWVYKFESGAVSYYHGASSTWKDLG